MATYKISKKADKDLRNIWKYTSKNWSNDQANKYLKLIIAEFEKVSNHPFIGRNYSNVSLDYFGSKVKSHIIFYKVIQENEIEIVRVLHQKMDLKKRINE